MRFGSLICISILLLAGCSAAVPPKPASPRQPAKTPQPKISTIAPSPVPTAAPAPFLPTGTHTEKARILEQSLSLKEAAEEYGLAAAESPTPHALLFKQGLLQEADGNNSNALKTLQKALELPGSDQALQRRITHSAALLLAAKLNRTAQAQSHIGNLPEGSPERLDLEAFLLHAGGNSAQAMPLLERALGSASEPNLQATIFYHLALAHEAIKETEKRGSSLFMAINLARERNLINDIEAFWYRINNESAPSP